MMTLLPSLPTTQPKRINESLNTYVTFTLFSVFKFASPACRLKMYYLSGPASDRSCGGLLRPGEKIHRTIQPVAGRNPDNGSVS